MSTQTFAEAITTRTADRGMFPTVPDEVGLDAAESAEALDLSALENADATDFGAAEYGEFWAQVAAAVDVIGDCNNPLGAAAALCAREGVEMIEQD